MRRALADELLARLGAEPFAPPTLATLAEALGRPPRELGRVLEVLARRGDVVRVDKDLWFAAAAVDEARARLVEMLGARRARSRWRASATRWAAGAATPRPSSSSSTGRA